MVTRAALQSIHITTFYQVIRDICDVHAITYKNQLSYYCFFYYLSYYCFFYYLCYYCFCYYLSYYCFFNT